MIVTKGVKKSIQGFLWVLRNSCCRKGNIFGRKMSPNFDIFDTWFCEKIVAEKSEWPLRLWQLKVFKKLH